MKNIWIVALASAVDFVGGQPADARAVSSDVKLISAAEGAAPCP